MIAQAKGDHDKESAGRAIVIAGLVIQLLSFACFVITAAIFHYRVKRQGFSQDRPGLWPVQIIVLYIGSALIFVRILVRVIEFAQGNNGFIISHEVFLYTLDAVPMYWLMVSMKLKANVAMYKLSNLTVRWAGRIRRMASWGRIPDRKGKGEDFKRDRGGTVIDSATPKSGIQTGR